MDIVAYRLPLRAAVGIVLCGVLCVRPCGAEAPNILWAGGGHTDVSAAVVSPDGDILATGSAFDATIKLCRTADASLIRTIDATLAGVQALAYSPDGQYIASGGDTAFGAGEETVKLFRAADGALVREFHGALQISYAVAFSPDGILLAAAKGNNIEIFRVTDGALLKVLSGHTFSVFDVAWSPNGRLLASASGDQTVKIWGVATGRVLRTLRGHTDFVDAVAFAPNGRTLASGGWDNTVRIWRVLTGSLQRTLRGHTDIVASVAYAPAGSLASGSWDGTIRLWDPTTGVLIDTLRDPSVANVDSVQFSSDGTTLYAGGHDSHARKWQVADGSLRLTFGHHTGPVTSVAYAPNGSTFASASKDLTARIWNASNGIAQQTLSGPLDVLNAVAYSPDGIVLAAACGAPPPDTRDQHIYLWDTSTGTLLQILDGHAGGSMAVVIAPDGSTVVSAGRDAMVKFWDLATGDLLDALSGPAAPVRAHLTADGLQVAIADSSGFVQFRRLSDGVLTKTVTSPASNGIADFALSPDGALLATAENGYGDNVKLFDIASGTLVRTFAGHSEGFAQAVAFSRDRSMLASGSGYSHELIFWNVGDGSIVARYDEETGWGLDPQSSIDFSPDGTTFGYGRNDATVNTAKVP